MPIVKIAVYADGRLEVDGAPSTIEALRTTLKGLSERKGGVWYYREAAEQEPPAIAMRVIDAVAEARLPIRMSTRPDYSDAVGFDGKPVGR